MAQAGNRDSAPGTTNGRGMRLGNYHMGVGIDQTNKQVVLKFSPAVEWFKLDPDAAKQLAKVLIAAADQCGLSIVQTDRLPPLPPGKE